MIWRCTECDWRGPEAASLEHALGHLGAVLEENEKLRAALESARTGLLGCLVYLDRRKSHPEAVFCDGTEILINNIDSALANEQKP